MKHPPITHPSFAKITLHKVFGNKRPLYGSKLEHSQTIQLAIHESSYERGLSHDHYNIEDRIIQVELTPLQWAEFISSFGTGEGTPCTITDRKGHPRIEAPPELSTAYHQVFMDEAQESIDRATENTALAATLLRNILNGGAVRKGDLQPLLSLLEKAQQDMQSNTHFVLESFERATKKVINEAKEEINAHFTSIVQQYGLKALAAENQPEVQVSKLEQSHE